MSNEDSMVIPNKKIWFASSMFGGEDQLDRFVSSSIWENGYREKDKEIVKEIKIGEEIIIKSICKKRKDLFLLKIRAKGRVISNNRDGRYLGVDWVVFKEPKYIFLKKVHYLSFSFLCC